MILPQIPKLPVWKTIAEVYTVTAHHIGDLLRFSWPWLLVLIAVSMVLNWSIYPTQHAAMVAGRASSEWISWISTIVSMAIGSTIAVPWHRLILLGEVPLPSAGLALAPATASYFWKSSLLLIAAVIPMWFINSVQIAIALSLPHDGSGPQSHFDRSAVLLVAFSFVGLIATIALARVWLILPATAIGRRAIGIGESWRATSGNSARLAFASIVAPMAPWLALLFVVYFLYPASLGIITADTMRTRTSFTVWNVVRDLVSILLGMLFVTFLSLAYRHFFGIPQVDASGRQPPNQPDPS